MINVEEIRKDFPILGRKIEGKPLVYLDSAASAQRPRQVIEAVKHFWENSNANVARSLHTLAEEATAEYETARKKTAAFIGANENEIIFTKNTTEAVNVVMRGYGEKFIGSRDTVTTSIMEHHSNFVPWQWLAKKKSAKFEVINVTAEGLLDESEFDKIDKSNLLAITMASNVLGTINDVRKLCKRAHETGALVFVDAAQAAPGMRVNVQELGCDFLAFSGHKMMAPFGIGVLYGRKKLLEEMDPFLYGSEMIRKVSIEESEWNELPHKFEAGTPAVDAAVGLAAAIDYINNIGVDNIRKHEMTLTKQAMEMLDGVGAKMLGPGKAEQRTGLVAFSLDGIHPHDVAVLLNAEGIAIRSGHHCAMPAHTCLGLPQGTNRASFYIYNSPEDIQALEDGIKKVKKIFSK
ncbi:Cysteine desulfurase [uncultured archaeon]|nr:Cysteine desulfurase [uncultured archaeon]